MKPKTIILMVVAVACGLVASYMTSRLLADRSAPPADNLVTVVVAKKKVAQLTIIRKPEELFELQQIPESPQTAKAVKTLEELKDKRLNKTLNEQTVVRTDDLMKKEDQIIEIPPGQRAIAIPVSAKIQVAGFILPGMRVDILCTMKRGDEPSSMIILQNMLVLAIDAQTGRPDSQSALLGQTATLAATPDECQKLMLAQQQGELCLALRNQEDKRLVTANATKVNDLGKPSRDRDPKTGEFTEDSSDPVQPGGVLGLGKDVSVKDTLPPITPTPPAQPQAVEPEVKLVEHTLTVQEGQYTQQYKFFQNPDSGQWQGGRASRGNDDEPAAPVRKPATPPAVKEEPKKTPAAEAPPADAKTGNGKKL